jgi:hypothetical protein
MPEQKEPFVPKEDRPEVKLPDPDRPISELRVRDLQAILGAGGLKKVEIKEPIKEPIKDFKEHKHEKWEIKEPIKDFKDHKHEKWEIKEPFKDLKDHIKEFKPEKIELEPGPKQQFEPGPDPTRMGDPAILAGLNQIIQTVAGLTKRVDDLANQVSELQKKVK